MVKKVLILFGSPRENSNTKALLQPFEQRLRALGCETEIIRAYDMKVRHCTACLNCQADLDRPACVYDDDMGEIYQKFLQSDLEQQGIQVVMTREEDKGLYSENASNKKREDLANRIGVITDTAPDFVICIHQNSFTDPMYKGAQVFYYKDSEEGARLASAIQEQLIAGVDPSNTRVAKSNMNYYMLKHSPAPMVIVECGFLTNTEEEALLGQEDYQRKLAWNIYLGIMQYLNSSGDTDAAA